MVQVVVVVVGQSRGLEGGEDGGGVGAGLVRAEVGGGDSVASQRRDVILGEGEERDDDQGESQFAAAIVATGEEGGEGEKEGFAGTCGENGEAVATTRGGDEGVALARSKGGWGVGWGGVGILNGVSPLGSKKSTESGV